MNTQLVLLNADNKIINIIYIEKDNFELYEHVMNEHNAISYVDLSVSPYPFGDDLTWDAVNKVWI